MDRVDPGIAATTGNGAVYWPQWTGGCVHYPPPPNGNARRCGRFWKVVPRTRFERVTYGLGDCSFLPRECVL